MGKRKKNFYCSNKVKRGKYGKPFEAGMKGFLITCGNNAEKDVIREAYSLLNEYADKMYGAENATEQSESEASSGEEEDIEKALEKQVKAIKTEKTTPRRFEARQTGANNCVFIKTLLSNPTELINAIVSDTHSTKVAKSRHIMKIFPVVASCRTESSKIRDTALNCLKAAFEGIEEFTYCCIFKIRNNSEMNRTKVLPWVCDAFTKLDSKSTVDYANPEYVISVDIIKSVCCFSVLKDFSKYRKYNLQEIVTVKEKKETEQKESNRTEIDQETEEKSNGAKGGQETEEKGDEAKVKEETEEKIKLTSNVKTNKETEGDENNEELHSN